MLFVASLYPPAHRYYPQLGILVPGLARAGILIAASMGRSGGNEPRLVACVTSLISAVTAAVYCFGHAGLVPQNSSARWHFPDRSSRPNGRDLPSTDILSAFLTV